MGLPADQLSPGEDIVLEMHEHWKHLIGAMLICLLALVGLVVVLAIPSLRFTSRMENAAGADQRAKT